MLICENGAHGPRCGAHCATVSPWEVAACMEWLQSNPRKLLGMLDSEALAVMVRLDAGESVTDGALVAAAQGLGMRMTPECDRIWMPVPELRPRKAENGHIPIKKTKRKISTGPAREGSVQACRSLKTGEVIFRGRIRLGDGTRYRIQIPDGVDEAEARRYVAGIQKREDEQGLLMQKVIKEREAKKEAARRHRVPSASGWTPASAIEAMIAKRQLRKVKKKLVDPRAR